MERFCEWCGNPLEPSAPRNKRFCGSSCRGRHSEWVKAGKPLRSARRPHKPRPRSRRAGCEVYLTDAEAASAEKGYTRVAVREKVRIALDRRER